ncbi:uncharacterized protein [Rhodnius prolixus]|uniref:uncharacterized protein n=1 Tax=Rhodnius prolixus TaxID=13249 RepID=UPI003D18A092
MDPEHLADQYVQEFVLDHFEDVAVKKEGICMERLPSMMNCNGGLVQLSHSPPPPPHHLLTPPGHQSDDYSVVNMTPHSIMMPQNAAGLMYPDTPGTPPDTPPESNSPRSPPSRHFIEPVQQHLTHQHKLIAAPGGPAPHMVDEMSWLMTSQPLRQEPLDLRPNSELPEEWSPLPQHPGVLAAPVKRINPEYHHHHHHHHHHPDDMDLNPPTPQVSISSSRSNSNTPRLNVMSSDDLINDDMLTQLSVRELNKRLHGFPREAVVKLKQKRRTLKNRGYAQNCRSKRLQQRHQLEVTNRNLQSELHRVKLDLARLIQERDMYKHRCEVMRRKELENARGSPISPETAPEMYV